MGYREDVETFLTDNQKTALQTIVDEYCKDSWTKIGVIEVYENGSLNVFLRKGPAVAAIITVRTEVQDGTRA